MNQLTVTVHRLKWLWRVLLVLSLLPLVFWAFDRSPPFEVLSVVNSGPARPGEQVNFVAKVRRDLDRECSVTFASYIYDSRGTRTDHGGTMLMTPDGLRELDAKAPGMLYRTITVPLGAKPGPAQFTTVMSYRCNLLQEVIKPIFVEQSFPFEVLP